MIANYDGKMTDDDSNQVSSAAVPFRALQKASGEGLGGEGMGAAELG